jgi:peroxiredoxin (alkyl hydroperoxide reductase subunit C)
MLNPLPMKKLKITLIIAAISTTIYAQDVPGIPLIGEEAPKFKSESTKGVVHFPKDFGTNWKLLVSHPQDFTPVCSSELLELASMQEEFEALNVDIILVSTDALKAHFGWKERIEQITYKNREPVEIKFPMVEDEKMKIAYKYGMMHYRVSTTRYVRGVFVIDPENIIRLIQFYPIEIGRNMVEIKRAIMAIQTNEKDGVLTPANWEPGDDVLLPSYDKDVLSNPNVYQLDFFMTFLKN